MKDRLQACAVPALTFALAVALSLITGPGFRNASARAQAQGTGGKCRCQLRVKTISLEMEIGLSRNEDVDGNLIEKEPVWVRSIDDFKLKGTICQEKRQGAPAAQSETKAWIELLTEITLIPLKNPGDLNKWKTFTRRVKTYVDPTKIDDLTCPGSEREYLWEPTINGLILDSDAAAAELYKNEKNFEVDAGLWTMGRADTGFKYGVETQAKCDGNLKDPCSDEVKIAPVPTNPTKKISSSRVCVTSCSFGTP